MIKKPTEQQEKILSTKGNLVVIAKPGSGKTFVISKKIVEIIKESLAYRGVIAISYTNKASTELKGRCLKDGDDPKGSFFGTIDKFVLSEIVIPFGKQIFGLPIDQLRVYKLQDLDDSDQEFYGKYYNGKSVENCDADLLERLGVDFVHGTICLEFCGTFARHILKVSTSCNRYLKARYSHVFIDEFQDSGEDQYEILLALERIGIESVAVGDIFQSIYAFSGKDSRYLLALAQNERFTTLPLTKNHRSHDSIVNYATAFISPKPDLIDCKDIRVFEKVVAGDEAAIGRWINQVIDTVMTKYQVRHPKDVGILVRSDRTAVLVTSALTLPYRYFSGTALDFDLSMWSEVFRRILYYIYDLKITCLDVVDGLYDPSRKKPEYKELCAKLKRLRELSNSVAENIIEILDVAKDCADIIHPKAESVRAIELLREVVSSSSCLSNYVPAEENEIQIMTIHKSKGLEFDVVFHLDLYEWILPAKTIVANKQVLSNLEQDRNLHYVGITRAKKACILCRSTQRHNFQNEIKAGNASEFLTLNRVIGLRVPSPW